jgi:uncharacterized protein YdbL (DUF1318 family)
MIARSRSGPETLKARRFPRRVAGFGTVLQTAVTTSHDARRETYAVTARQAGTTPDVAAARMFESQLMPRITSGQWYRNAAGPWVQR